MRCLILDGWHKGTVLVRENAPTRLAIPRPEVFTYCSCHGAEDADEYHVPAGHPFYQRCWVADDGKLALYTVRGDSEEVLRNVAALDYRTRPLGLDRIIVDCHDPLAWPTESYDATPATQQAEIERLTRENDRLRRDLALLLPPNRFTSGMRRLT